MDDSIAGDAFAKVYHSKVNEEGSCLWIGKEAELSSLRPFQSRQVIITTNDNKNSSNNTTDELLLCHIPSASVSLSLQSSSFQFPCQIMVTTQCLIAVAHTEQDFNKEFTLKAQGISLHALTSEPEKTVYCQLSDDLNVMGFDEQNEDDIYITREVVIQPKGKNDLENQELCDSLFQAMSRMISLNPVHGEEGGDHFTGGGLGAMLGLMAQAYGEDDIDDDDDAICRIDPNAILNRNEEADGASSSARMAMLERLDNILTVPEEYEIADGQFDDASSSEKDNIL